MKDSGGSVNNLVAWLKYQLGIREQPDMCAAQVTIIRSRTVA